MKHLRVAVLRGGPSEEYEVSLETGSTILSALSELGYFAKDIIITRHGEWLHEGIVKQPRQALEAIDVVFIALHGRFGEDGTIQRLLQNLQIPYTGSSALTSNLALNKVLTKNTLNHLPIRIPKHYTVSNSDLLRLEQIVPEINRVLGDELFIKPITSGSSLGARYVGDPTYLYTTLEELLQEYDELMIEEYIRGKEATVGILENFRRESLYALPVVEIIPPHDDPIFSYENKYNGRSTELCPGRFSYREKALLESIARDVHATLRCNHYSRSDFIVRDGEVYFLEINTLPGLTNESLYPKSAAAIGLSYHNLIEHLLTIALRQQS